MGILLALATAMTYWSRQGSKTSPVGQAERPVDRPAPVAVPVASIVPPSPPTSQIDGPPPETGGWVLPRPSLHVGFVGVGFPHTTLGAVGLALTAMEARDSADPAVGRAVIMATALQTDAHTMSVVDAGTAANRAAHGFVPGGPGTLQVTLTACRVDSASPDAVVVGLGGVEVASGPGIPTSTSAYSIPVRLVWARGDWKIDGYADLPQPDLAWPGTPAGDASGWHACHVAD
jgi:hypothetical protein